jgi:ankyrin repeat protein
MNLEELRKMIESAQESGLKKITLSNTKITPEILDLILLFGGELQFTFQECHHDMSERGSVGLAGAGSSVMKAETKSDTSDIDKKLQQVIDSCETLNRKTIKFNDTVLQLDDDLIRSILKYVRKHNISFIFDKGCKLQSVSTNLIKLLLEHDLKMAGKTSPILHSLDISNLSEEQIKEIIEDIWVVEGLKQQSFNDYKKFLPEGLFERFEEIKLAFLTKGSLKDIVDRRNIRMLEMGSFLEDELPTNILEKQLFLDQLYQRFGFFPIQEAIPSLKLRNQFPKDMNEEEKSAKVQALLFLIKHDERLRAIDLSDNHLGDDAISLIADSLKDNESISEVNFKNTRCYRDDTLDKIMMMLRINKQILRFTILFSNDAPSPDLMKVKLLKLELERRESRMMPEFSISERRFENIVDETNGMLVELFEAIIRDDVVFLMRFRGNIHLRNTDGSNALIFAAKSGSFNVLKYLIEEGVGRSIDCINPQNGKTALMEACANKDPRCAALLIQSGASLTIEDKAKKTANDYAKYYNLAKIKDSLPSEIIYGNKVRHRYWDARVKIKKPTGEVVEVPIGKYLGAVSRRGELETLKKLEKYLGLVDDYGRSALINAFSSVDDIICNSLKSEEEAIKEAKEIAEYIIQTLPYSLELVDDYGSSCVIFAVSKKGSIEFLELLSKTNAFKMHINTANYKGVTPLHLAIRAEKPLEEKLEVIKLLIRNGANLGAIDPEGFLPLDYADDEIKSEVYSLIAKEKDKVFFKLSTVAKIAEPITESQSPYHEYDLFMKDIGSDQVEDILKQLIAREITAKSLNLGRNNIGDEGAKLIAQALEHTDLIGLDLNSNNIGDAGALALAEALKKPTSKLTSLNLCTNEIGLPGVIELAEALRTNKTLKELGLYCNDIGSEGLVAIAEALKTNRTLIKITIGYGKLSPESLEVLNDINKIIEENAIADKLIQEFSLQHLLSDESTISTAEDRLDSSLAPRVAGASASASGGAGAPAGGGSAYAGGGAGAPAGGGSASAAQVRLAESGVYDFSKIDSKSALKVMDYLLSRSRSGYDVIEAIKNNERNSSGKILLNKVRFALRDESIDSSFKTILLKSFFLDLKPDFLIAGEKPPELPIQIQKLIVDYVGPLANPEAESFLSRIKGGRN